jgi:non-ribosomal peptide synthetase component E (peptide arylation enzyme)
VTHTVLVPTMLNLLTQFPDVRKYDLSSLGVLGYGGARGTGTHQSGERASAER